MLGGLDSVVVLEVALEVLVVGQVQLAPQLSHSDDLVLWCFL
jgi:hypothetical protein